jgi:hypothetical protein
VHIPVGELNSREPIANVVELSHQPALILPLPRPLGIAALPPLIPVRFSRCIRLGCWHAEDSPNGILSNSLVVIESWIRRLSRILCVVLRCWILLHCSAIGLHLCISVSAADADFLPTHRAILATILDELDRAELVEEMAARQLAGRDHLILANSAVFELAYLSGLEVLSLRIHLE